MEIIKILNTYLLTVAIFLTVDLLWLGVIAKSFYAKQLATYMTDKVNWPAAITFYLFFVFGIIYFAVMPAIAANSLTKAVINGALLGALAYATYDMTNLATIKNWPLTLTVVDIIWGTLLTAFVSAIGLYVARWLA